MHSFDKSLPMMLNRTLNTVIPMCRKVFKEHNISEQQWRILRVLCEITDCTSVELSTRTLLPSPSLVGIVNRMSTKGLLTRQRSSKDRRIVHISLTDKGHEVQAAIMPQIDDIYKQLMNRCDDESWENMINTLQLIIDDDQKSQP